MAVKQTYETPEMKIVRFATEDVIAGSNEGPGQGESSFGWDW